MHIEELQEGAVVFYLSPKDDYDLPAVAFFRKTEKGRWIGVGLLDLLDYRGGKLFFDLITADLNPEETHDERVQVIYGQINDPDITEVKVRSADNKFVNVEIIEIPKGRFYFIVGKYNLLQAIDMNGTVVEEYPIFSGDHFYY